VIKCSFELNGKPMSKFMCGQVPYDAFSGFGKQANTRAQACVPKVGPIPPGQYYIIDRQLGGLKKRLRQFFDMRDPKGSWFALYVADGCIDDLTFCNEIERGNFRLHPKGRWELVKAESSSTTQSDLIKWRRYCVAP
jgi:hypothetical protein